MRKFGRLEQHAALRVLLLRASREVGARDERAFTVDDDALGVHVEPGLGHESTGVVVDAGAGVAERSRRFHHLADGSVSVGRGVDQQVVGLLDVDEEAHVDLAVAHRRP
jgi:hypothetical protein